MPRDIEVNPLSLKRLFESSFYTIDYYQREYAWGEEEVRTLVTDLRDAFEDWAGAREFRRKPDRAPQYFLGPFVYYEQATDLRYLVDGQQRFTTLHLIFMNLRVIGRQLEEQRHVEMLTPVIRQYDNRPQPYSVQQRDLMELVRALLPGLRGCGSADDVSQVLAKHIAEDDQGPVTLEGFGLRGTNRHQIKYLLARLTAYAMKGVGRVGNVDEYLSDTHAYQIEHLFANKPGRHSSEIPDPLRFRSLRNQLGGLVLLPASDNESLGAMPLDEKILRYGRQNVLVGVLNHDYHKNFKDLREFAKENEVEAFFRAFGGRSTMTEIIAVRQELYLRLCARIWGIDRLGVNVASIPGFLDPFARSVATAKTGTVASVKLKTDVARMVGAGVLQSGTRIVLNHRGRDYWAGICSDGRVKLEDTGTVYSKVDEAGCIVRETRTCDGMKLWCVPGEDGTRTPLRELRDAAREAGILGANRR